MLKIEEFRTIFFMASLVGVLAIASPTLFLVYPMADVEGFSELYVLGPNRMADGYPFTVKANETHKIFLGVVNHLGSSAYYVLYVKFGDHKERLPDSTSGMPSPLPALYEYRAFLLGRETWEVPLTFSFTRPSKNSSVESLMINGLTYNLSKMVSWDSENQGFLFELWIYDPELRGFRFHNRFASLGLNATVSA